MKILFNYKIIYFKRTEVFTYSKTTCFFFQPSKSMESQSFFSIITAYYMQFTHLNRPAGWCIGKNVD